MEGQLETLEKELKEEQKQIFYLQQRLENKKRQMKTARGCLTRFDKHLQTLNTDKETLQKQLREEQKRVYDLQRRLVINERETRLLKEEPEVKQNRTHQDWVINRSEIQITDHELGRGAWGTVYRGRFCAYDVAVKAMHDNILSPHNRDLFEREVRIASKCHHPCLLQFIGATADEGRPLIVTEIMDCSLRERLYDKGDFPLSTQEVSIISPDVALALNYLHQKPRPIIHHDISSANVLLRRHGNQWRAKVSDYGTANFVRQCTRNDTGAAMYSAPESLNETPNQPISCKVSMYAVRNQLYYFLELQSRTI